MQLKLEDRFSFGVLQPEHIQQHLNQLKEIAADIPKEAWDISEYLFELPEKWHYSVIAFDEKHQVAGFIIASKKDASVHIHKYAVHPHYRSQNLGRYLLAILEKKVRQSFHLPVITLYVDKSNERAISFYVREGFTLRGHKESMVYMQKPLATTLAIHQPNFFPWLGFFDKLVSADRFVILDHVSNNPASGILTKRVTLLINGTAQWWTVPLVKPKEQLFQPINEMELALRPEMAQKQIKMLDHAFRKAPFFDEIFPLILDFYNHPSPLVAERNEAFITRLCSALGITTPFILSSKLGVHGHSNELLINIIRQLNGTVYLHGSGAVYQNDQLFQEAGIILKMQEFNHPVYKQFNNKGCFASGLSIIDALMNLGLQHVSHVVKKTTYEYD